MIDLVHPEWPAPPSVRAVMSTRHGGVSEGAYASLNLGSHCGDDPACVAANRSRLAAALKLPRAVDWLSQVHGCDVTRATAGATPRADAVWSDVPGQVCAVLVADCLPILLCDVDGTCVAAVHAGWRGLAAGVVEAAVAALPVAPERLMAWRGAAIGPDAFEVGGEVRNAFTAVQPQAAAAFRPAPRPGHYLADLFALACQRLQRAGVSRIHGGGMCTVSAPDRFFSYRRDGVTGRMAALIWIDESAR